MAKIKVNKRVKRITTITFAALCYVLSIICICAGIAGINTSRQNLYRKQSVNVNINKTVSTKDLMASFQRINAKREAEARAKREAAERAKREAEAKKAEEEARKAASLGPTAPKGEIQQYAHDLVVGSYGWTESDFSALVKLWNRESGWNPNSVNRNSGTCGIPQAVSCNAIINSQGDLSWQSQVKWGLNYINRRYTTPAKAWAFFQRNWWY